MARPPDPANEEERRLQLMTSTYECLIERSWRALTLEEVAQRAGLSKGLVVYYFGGKDQLILETIRWFLDLQISVVMSIVRGEGTAKQRLASILEVALPEHEEMERQMRFQLEVWSFGKTQPEALEALRGAYRRFREAAHQVIAVARKEGYITARDDEWSYRLLHALLDGLSFQIVLEPELDVEKLRRRALLLFERALRPPGG